MRPTNVEIFATPEEQLAWLQSAVNDADVWCVYERSRIGLAATVSIGELKLESLGNEHSRSRLFLGRSALHEPVWRTTDPSEIEFVASQAVLFEPAVRGRRALIAGRLAIMNKRDYDDAGVLFDPLKDWYEVLRRSLRRSLSAPFVKLMVTAPLMPRAKARGAFIVSRMAVELARTGLPLKQFPESRVQFEVA